MPRVRAFVLLSLFLVNQAACYSCQVPGPFGGLFDGPIGLFEQNTQGTQ